MSKSVKVTTEPYLLIALHAAKYSDHNIFGYLLGTEVGNVTNITAVLPVGHNAPAGPILEISGQVVSVSSIFSCGHLIHLMNSYLVGGQNNTIPCKGCRFLFRDGNWYSSRLCRQNYFRAEEN